MSECNPHLPSRFCEIKLGLKHTFNIVSDSG